MSAIAVRGLGIVSPAGWGLAAFRQALQQNTPLPATELSAPGRSPFRVRAVPPPTPRPAFLAHPRLRRSCSIAQFTVAAALEALGMADGLQKPDFTRLGIIYCTMAGCVNYSRRFYDETLRDPATASPLVFPETVFNSPASHLAAVLGATSVNDTLVGDPGTYLQALALGADWLERGVVDGCLVVAAEELDWILAEAARSFSRRTVLGAGAAAVYLVPAEDNRPAVHLQVVTESYAFAHPQSRLSASRRMRAELAGCGRSTGLLCDGLQGVDAVDQEEAEVWRDWTGPRLSPKRLLGESFMVSSAWQCVAGIDAVDRGLYPCATISVVGCNQQAIGAIFA